MMKKINLGFTLIELLVVISIIGILAALILASFTTSQRQARDAQRKSDIKQYATLLEQYANNNNGLYPVHSSGATGGPMTLTAGNTLCGTDLGQTSCPVDPTATGDHVYRYQSNGAVAGANATAYVLWVQLESSGNWWIECSNGKVGTYTYSSWTGPTYDSGANTISCPL